MMLEQIHGELCAVQGLVADEPTMGDFRRLEASVDELRADAKGIKKVVGDHSGELTQLDSRVST
jgi:hypothetical protein